MNMRINHHHHRADHILPEQMLAQNVIRQAFVDAVCKTPNDRGNGGTSTLHQHQADLWFRNCGQDFRLICAIAGIDADSLSEKYRAGAIDKDAFRKRDERKA